MPKSSTRRIGDFLLAGELSGKGGQGRLFAARCERDGVFGALKSGDVVALKVMPVRGDDAERAYRRLERRTNALIASNHPGIVRYFGCFAEEGGLGEDVHVVVMELLHGQTLEERLRGEPLGLDAEEALRIVRICLEALVCASGHGIVHRDIKPSNVFLCEDGGVKLIDFEIAQAATTAQTTTESGAMQGTYDYMAPDFHPDFRPDPKFRGDACSDVFSLSVLFHEALTGRRPYPTDKMAGDQSMMAFFQRWSKTAGRDVAHMVRVDALRVHALRHVQRVLKKGLSPERARRYQTYAEMLEALAVVSVRELRGGRDAYRLSVCVGKGGFGAVYKAWRVSDGAAVAAKFLTRADSDGRFWREARTLERFHDDRIVPFIESFQIGHETPTPVLVMAFLPHMPGSSLKERLTEDKNKNGLPVRNVLPAFARYAEGLAILHRAGVVHRDIKPANLYLPAGEPEKACLMDLGIVRTSGTQTSGGLPGTPDYMAPELAKSTTRGDARSDLYALGLCLYEALTGRTAFPRLPRGQEAYSAWFERARRGDAPDLSGLDDFPEAKELVASLIDSDPMARLADASKVADLMRDLPVREKAPPVLQPTDSITFGEAGNGTGILDESTDEIPGAEPEPVPEPESPPESAAKSGSEPAREPAQEPVSVVKTGPEPPPVPVPVAEPVPDAEALPPPVPESAGETHAVAIPEPQDAADTRAIETRAADAPLNEGEERADETHAADVPTEAVDTRAADVPTEAAETRAADAPTEAAETRAAETRAAEEQPTEAATAADERTVAPTKTAALVDIMAAFGEAPATEARTVAATLSTAAISGTDARTVAATVSTAGGTPPAVEAIPPAVPVVPETRRKASPPAEPSPLPDSASASTTASKPKTARRSRQDDTRRGTSTSRTTGRTTLPVPSPSTQSDAAPSSGVRVVRKGGAWKGAVAASLVAMLCLAAFLIVRDPERIANWMEERRIQRLEIDEARRIAEAEGKLNGKVARIRESASTLKGRVKGAQTALALDACSSEFKGLSNAIGEALEEARNTLSATNAVYSSALSSFASATNGLPEIIASKKEDLKRKEQQVAEDREAENKLNGEVEVVRNKATEECKRIAGMDEHALAENTDLPASIADQLTKPITEGRKTLGWDNPAVQAAITAQSDIKKQLVEAIASRNGAISQDKLLANARVKAIAAAEQALNETVANERKAAKTLMGEIAKADAAEFVGIGTTKAELEQRIDDAIATAKKTDGVGDDNAAVKEAIAAKGELAGQLDKAVNDRKNALARQAARAEAIAAAEKTLRDTVAKEHEAARTLMGEIAKADAAALADIGTKKTELEQRIADAIVTAKKTDGVGDDNTAVKGAIEAKDGLAKELGDAVAARKAVLDEEAAIAAAGAALDKVVANVKKEAGGLKSDFGAMGIADLDSYTNAISKLSNSLATAITDAKKTKGVDDKNATVQAAEQKRAELAGKIKQAVAARGKAQKAIGDALAELNKVVKDEGGKANDMIVRIDGADAAALGTCRNERDAMAERIDTAIVTAKKTRGIEDGNQTVEKARTARDELIRRIDNEIAVREKVLAEAELRGVIEEESENAGKLRNDIAEADAGNLGECRKRLNEMTERLTDAVRKAKKVDGIDDGNQVVIDAGNVVGGLDGAIDARQKALDKVVEVTGKINAAMASSKDAFNKYFTQQRFPGFEEIANLNSQVEAAVEEMEKLPKSDRDANVLKIAKDYLEGTGKENQKKLALKWCARVKNAEDVDLVSGLILPLSDREKADAVNALEEVIKQDSQRKDNSDRLEAEKKMLQKISGR